MKKLIPLFLLLSTFGCDPNKGDPEPPHDMEREKACSALWSSYRFPGTSTAIHILSVDDNIIACSDATNKFIVNFGINKENNPAVDAQLKLNIPLHDQIPYPDMKEAVKNAMRDAALMKTDAVLALQTIAVYNNIIISNYQKLTEPSYYSALKTLTDSMALHIKTVSYNQAQPVELILSKEMANITLELSSRLTNPDLVSFMNYLSFVLVDRTAIEPLYALEELYPVAKDAINTEYEVMLIEATKADDRRAAILALGELMKANKAYDAIVNKLTVEADLSADFQVRIKEDNHLTLSGTCDRNIATISVNAKVKNGEEVVSSQLYSYGSCVGGVYLMKVDIGLLSLEANRREVALKVFQDEKSIQNVSLNVVSPLQTTTELSFVRDQERMEADSTLSLSKTFYADIIPRVSDYSYTVEVISGGNVCVDPIGCNSVSSAAASERMEMIEDANGYLVPVTRTGSTEFTLALNNTTDSGIVKVKYTFSDALGVVREEYRNITVSKKIYTFTSTLKLSPEVNAVTGVGGSEQYYTYTGECKAGSFVAIYYQIDSNDVVLPYSYNYNYDDYCVDNHYTLRVNSLFLKANATANSNRAKLNVYQNNPMGAILFESYVLFSHDYVP